MLRREIYYRVDGEPVRIITREAGKHMRLIVNIDVPDLSLAIGFYSSALGLALSRILDDGVAELTGGSSVLYLLENTAGSAATSSVAEKRRYTRHWTPVHIDFVVDDLLASAARAIKAGASQGSECVEWRGSKCMTFSDPFGHGFCLIEFDGEPYSQGQLCQSAAIDSTIGQRRT